MIMDKSSSRESSGEKNCIHASDYTGEISNLRSLKIHIFPFVQSQHTNMILMSFLGAFHQAPSLKKSQKENEEFSDLRWNAWKADDEGSVRYPLMFLHLSASRYQDICEIKKSSLRKWWIFIFDQFMISAKLKFTVEMFILSLRLCWIMLSKRIFYHLCLSTSSLLQAVALKIVGSSKGWQTKETNPEIPLVTFPKLKMKSFPPKKWKSCWKHLIMINREYISLHSTICFLFNRCDSIFFSLRLLFPSVSLAFLMVETAHNHWRWIHVCVWMSESLLILVLVGLCWGMKSCSKMPRKLLEG